MQKVISISVNLPAIPTGDFRTVLRDYIVEVLDVSVNDIWDGEDYRPQSEEPVREIHYTIQNAEAMPSSRPR